MDSAYSERHLFAIDEGVEDDLPGDAAGLEEVNALCRAPLNGTLDSRLVAAGSDLWVKKGGTWKMATHSPTVSPVIAVAADGVLLGYQSIWRNGREIPLDKLAEDLKVAGPGSAPRYTNLSARAMNSDGAIVALAADVLNPGGQGHKTLILLLPVKFEVKHTEKTRNDDGTELSTTVSPGKDTLLRDEIADLRIMIPPLGNADWDFKVDLEPTDMKTQTLGGRGAVQMYDFGKVENGNVTSLTTEADGTTKPGPYDIKLLASKNGEETFRIAVNKEGKFKLRLKTPDNKIDVTSQEFTVTKRIRKYGKDNATTTCDFNKHDKHFENVAASWGAFYQHQVDDIERLKAIGMTESELGRNPQNPSARPDDIMTIGHPDDHVLDTLRFVSGHQEKEVDPQNDAVRDLNYLQAAASPAGTAIHWGTCWVYHKAQAIANNPQPPPSLIPGSWRSWDDATTRYNGGGVNNYLERVTRAFIEGRHPTDQTTVWPLLTNGRARK
jgi:hypothetical protein